MQVLVVGGAGMIGAHVARQLAGEGHAVTIAGRTRPAAGPVADLPFLAGDYVARTFTTSDLAPFEAIVFAAGQDVRHVRGAADDAFWRATQSEGVPAFARLAREAGVRRFVQIGSYYHVVMPELAATIPYIRARQLADEGARALATPDFAAITLNPPSIVGTIPGPSEARYRGLVEWARGRRDVPDFAPAGGTNYLSARSLAQAVQGALERGEGGRAYLVGDENLTYRQFFQTIFDAAGAGRQLEERDEPHPMLPDNYIVHGRGVTLSYQPDPADVALLGYDRGDIARAIGEIVAKIDQAVPA